ncbi:MAG: phosphoribosylglycinamide formyltransferase [Actinobacteria bacterium]|nr:phosphoribosylglycinamide formyltransferase [Actinomycetota bacterium]MBU1943434.1 phosphoribosylglycinamide formyltransferase [Actinomycetota bacterium]MBU2686791.1 phosphoribosylglycinamide formyltransferase [Actinomycetota bacterium]
MADRLKIAVLASGSGTNLEAIAGAIDRGEVPAQIVLVLSDNPDAYALERARGRGIPTKVVLPADYPDRPAFDAAIVESLKEAGVGLVVLAGYMKLVGPAFVEAFRGRIMNIHPALLPGFPGEHGVEDALAHGVKVSGVTVHFVDDGLDTGPIIVQAAVPVQEEDDKESLHNRIHEQEYRVYPEAIKLFAEGRLRIEGRRVRIV